MELSFHFLLFQSYYWISVCVWNFWSFKYPIFHVRNETPCTWALMYVHTWLARDSFPELAFFSPFPQQCQLLQSISFCWNGEFEFRSIHCIRTFRERNEMDLPFRFDFFQKSCFPFQSKLTCKRKDRKFIYFSFFISLKIRSIYNFTFFKSHCSDFCFIH